MSEEIFDTLPPRTIPLTSCNRGTTATCGFRLWQQLGSARGASRLSSWTDERIARLRSMWLAGDSASVIADELGGISRNGCLAKLDRLGLLKTRPVGRREGRVRRRSVVMPRLPSASASKTVGEPAPPLILDDGSSVTMATLGTEMCKFPIGDPKEAGFRFCGNERRKESSYCAAHHAICYQKTLSYRQWLDQRVIIEQERRAA